jgi:hypothetical protein
MDGVKDVGMDVGMECEGAPNRDRVLTQFLCSSSMHIKRSETVLIETEREEA